MRRDFVIFEAGGYLRCKYVMYKAITFDYSQRCKQNKHGECVFQILSNYGFTICDGNKLNIQKVECIVYHKYFRQNWLQAI